MHKIKNKGMVLKLDSVSERRSQRPSSRHPLIMRRDGPSFIFPTAEPPQVLSLSLARPPEEPPLLLQEGVELSLDVVEGVFAHVVHLARFPSLFPLL